MPSRDSPIRKISGRYNLRDDLSWSPHIDYISKKANQTLGFLKRNIKVHNKDLKSKAYSILERPQFEYTSSVWFPDTATNIAKHEVVQRWAARWATSWLPAHLQRDSNVKGPKLAHTGIALVK